MAHDNVTFQRHTAIRKLGLYGGWGASSTQPSARTRGTRSITAAIRYQHESLPHQEMMHYALYQNSLTKPVVLLIHRLPLLFFAGIFLLTTDSVRVVSRPLILTVGLRVTPSTEVIGKVVTERSNSLSEAVAP